MDYRNKLNLELTSMSPRRKHSLELTSLYSDESGRTPKKVDTPISDKCMPVVTSERYAYEAKLIEFLEDEIRYCQTFKLVLTVYQSILNNVRDYENILTASEQSLLFEDVGVLSQLSSDFIQNVVTEMSRISRTLTRGINEEDLTELNVPYMVYNCRLEKLDIGRLFNQSLADNIKYKTTIVRYFAKFEFMTNMVAQKNNSFPLVGKWLTSGNRLINNRSRAVNLEVLLVTPLEKINRYPGQLKQLRDSCPVEIQYELDLCLIKVNKIRDAGYEVPKITNWDQLRELNVSKKTTNTLGELNNHLEYGLQSAHEYRMDGTKASKSKIPTAKTGSSGTRNIAKAIGTTIKSETTKKWSQKNLNPLNQHLGNVIKQFQHKYLQIQDYKQELNRFTQQVRRFSDTQIHYGRLWKQMLEGDSFADNVLDKYTDKLKLLSNGTTKFQGSMASLIQRIDAILKYLKPIKNSIKSYEQKPQPQQAQLHQKLSAMVEYMDDTVILLQAQMMRYYKKWMYEFIGPSKLEEYQKEGKNWTRHEDIIRYYESRTD